MLRILTIAAALLLPLAARAQTEQQTLVDRATLTVQEMLSAPHSSDRLWAMKRARAVMICPQVFRASFFFGGAGGACVLVARDGAGSWSAPAFYELSTASFGLQAGLQDSEILLTVMNDKALAAIMDSQFKIGADASISFAALGAGIGGATTAALNADLLSFAQTRGLYLGVSLDGSILTSQTKSNHAYYGQDLAARQIVLQMQVNNPGADPLRATLARYANESATPPPPPGAPTDAQTNSPPTSPQPLAPPSDNAPSPAPVTGEPLSPPKQ